MGWLGYALVSAVFAAFTAILAKVGMREVNSDLATAIRTVVILFFSWTLVFSQNLHLKFGSISRISLVLIILSGLATGASWIFYFKALQMGNVSQVAAIDKLSLVFTIILGFLVLRENLSLGILLGALLMATGAIILTLSK